MNIIHVRSGRVLPNRSVAASRVIVHSTGETDLAAILKFYTTPGSVCPHYVVAHDGTVHGIVPEDHVAWHVAYAADVAATYGKGLQEWQRWRMHGGKLTKSARDGYYAGWNARWPGLSDPRTLAGPRPNYMSIGIELQALDVPTARIFTDAQYTALVELTSDICKRINIVPSQRTVFGHSDADPIARSNDNGQWDPGVKFDWEAISAGVGFSGVNA